MARTALLPLALLALATACGQGPVGNSTSPFAKGFRTSFRTNFVAQCSAGARTASHLDKDFTAVCGCVADKLIATKNVGDLMKGASKEETRQLAVVCVREHPLS